MTGQVAYETYCAVIVDGDGGFFQKWEKWTELSLLQQRAWVQVAAVCSAQPPTQWEVTTRFVTATAGERHFKWGPFKDRATAEQLVLNLTNNQFVQSATIMEVEK
jgi:hypothetical protein